NAAHIRLAAEFSFGADLARHAGDFGREGVELVDHGVDRVVQLEDFSPYVDRDVLGAVAGRDGGRDVRDVANLVGEIVRHEVDVVGQVAPRAAESFDFSLAAKFSFGADFTCDADHFRREGRKLVDHGVDRLDGAEEFSL